MLAGVATARRAGLERNAGVGDRPCRRAPQSITSHSRAYWRAPKSRWAQRCFPSDHSRGSWRSEAGIPRPKRLFPVATEHLRTHLEQ